MLLDHIKQSSDIKKLKEDQYPELAREIGYSTGYDFQQKEVTATSFNLTRDLHCWEMTFSCIPFGTHQSYNFQINVRSSLLKDLKLTKRDSWYDRR